MLAENIWFHVSPRQSNHRSGRVKMMLHAICIPLRILVLVLMLSGLCEVNVYGQASTKTKSAVAFRLTQWRTVHFDDVQKATVHSETLKKIGCEVGSEAHAGHTDVVYRAVRWILLEPDSKVQTDQWEKWLTQSGFEILRGQSKAAQPQVDSQTTTDVKYKLASPRLRHFPKDDERREYVTITQALGCVVTQIAHDGHTDVKVECPDWMQADFPNHDVAHAWEAWLQKAGFETEHKH